MNKLVCVMTVPLLDIRNLTFVAGDRTILDHLDLTISRREIHALLGANGSGKTTLAYLLMGCDGYVPTTGTVMLNGADLLSLKMYERAKLGVTLAWQEPARFEGIIVHEYLTLGRSEADPEPALLQVGLDPKRYVNRRVDKALSGGERHRIELASVLAMKPTLAILDEPAAGIDMLSINHIINVIRTIKNNGGAVLLITHQEEVAAIADSASQLCNGQIIFSGDPAHVIEHFRGRTCVRCDGEVCGYVRA
ncbi:MAG: ATP-binding cassette domain-containing protein [Nitrospira sp.]